tara:strand:- start:1090 stop:1311 length:222 start_codon:yes stop_codon:yes gene_type:complete
MSLKKETLSINSKSKVNEIHQGDCVQLVNDKSLFQVLGIDNSHTKCWIRKWPLLTSGSPVFEIEINQIVIPTV